jgi:hypothetical protein
MFLLHKANMTVGSISLYIVSPFCPLKINTTTIKDTDQEAEIINTTKRMVSKIPMKSCSCLLQEM